MKYRLLLLAAAVTVIGLGVGCIVPGQDRGRERGPEQRRDDKHDDRRDDRRDDKRDDRHAPMPGLPQ